MTHQAHSDHRSHADPIRRKDDRSSAEGMHIPAQDARQAEIVLDTPRKRALVIGIFVVGLVVLAALILAYA